MKEKEMKERKRERKKEREREMPGAKSVRRISRVISWQSRSLVEYVDPTRLIFFVVL